MQHIATWDGSILFYNMYTCIYNFMSNLPFIFKFQQRTASNAFNTLRLEQNGWHFADNSFKFIFLNENHYVD